MSKLQTFQGIAQHYMQWLATISKSKGSKCYKKAQSMFSPKIHLIIPLDMILGQKLFPRYTQVGKTFQIL